MGEHMDTYEWQRRGSTVRGDASDRGAALSLARAFTEKDHAPVTLLRIVASPGRGIHREKVGEVWPLAWARAA